MFDFMSDMISGITWQRAVLGVVLFLITFTGSLGLVSLILIKLPADYFCSHYDRQIWSGRAPALRIAAAIGKNLLGIVLIMAGIVMTLPGVPGQGLLTILLGIMLVDFPGKDRLERKLLYRPAVRNSIDKLRARFGKPPLQLD
jgi:archaellum biogenesis protein FlaJ (TadC family)